MQGITDFLGSVYILFLGLASLGTWWGFSGAIGGFVTSRVLWKRYRHLDRGEINLIFLAWITAAAVGGGLGTAVMTVASIYFSPLSALARVSGFAIMGLFIGWLGSSWTARVLSDSMQRNAHEDK